MAVSIQINDFYLCKAFYSPDEPACFTLSVTSHVEWPLEVRLVAQITHLEWMAGRIEQVASLVGGDQTFSMAWIPQPIAPAGYGVDLSILAPDGALLASASTSFDVLDHWTQMPRYGFMTDFSPGRSDGPAALDQLNRYHINGLLFYDWMPRHEQFLADADPYRDPLGRELSRRTIDGLIAAARGLNMATMPYTTAYAASPDFSRQHPDWALFGVDGKPLTTGDNFLAFMDPRPDSPWTQYLLNQISRMLEKTGFDGVHLDQSGDPKTAYDAHGRAFRLESVMAGLVDASRKVVTSRRREGAVVFNAAGNWPIETVAPSPQDFVYVEVRPPYTGFDSLRQLIVQGQSLGRGKPVVLAAYVDPQHERNVRLIDAVIFAGGGGHIELGEGDGLLCSSHHPRYGKVSPALAGVLRRYYDFAVRYENVIGPATTDAPRAYQDRIQIPGIPTSPGAPKDKVMILVRETPGYTAINLVNLLGVARPEWAVPLPTDPTPLDAFTLQLTGMNHRIKAAWLASPDGPDSSLQPLKFTQDDDRLALSLPGLAYWSMVLIHW